MWDERALLETNLPGVSIMKPLKGVDDNLYENLDSYFTLEYPKYELVFCVQDASDPAIEIVRQLIAKYPLVDARLFYGCKNNQIKQNFKINFF